MFSVFTPEIMILSVEMNRAKHDVILREQAAAFYVLYTQVSSCTFFPLSLEINLKNTAEVTGGEKGSERSSSIRYLLHNETIKSRSQQKCFKNELEQHESLISALCERR